MQLVVLSKSKKKC